MNSWGLAAFSPRRIALVGASREPGKVGGTVLDNLLAAGMADVVPIHPTATEILGRASYPTVSDIPGHVDLAIIVTPPAAVVGVIQDCVRSCVSVAAVISGGFAETGRRGAELEITLARVARDGGVRVVGPNCLGLINVHRGLNASLAMGVPVAGGVSLFTQSGAYGMAAFSRSKEGTIGFAKVLAAGNKSDIAEADAVRFFGEDPETHVIALVLESIVDGPAFVMALRAVTSTKPVVILKVGRTRAGMRAAASHTAAHAQDFPVTREVLRQAGAVVVEDGLTLFDVAAALDRQAPLRGRRVAIITNSGGTGVELADLLESEGLEVPALSDALRTNIARHLPEHGSANNPVDVTTQWARFPEMYRQSLRALLASEEIDAVIPVLLQRSALDPGVTDAVIDEVRAASARGIAKPVHVCWAAPVEGEPQRQKLLDAGIPCHEWGARAARILARCRLIPPAAVPALDAPFAPPHEVPADGWLAPDRVFSLLSHWGLPVAPWRLVHDAAGAVAAAAELGFPVVMKAVRPGLVHKTEVGAVRLALSDPNVVSRVFAEWSTTLGSGPAILQRQIAGGVEIALGAVRDATFGPLVMCGLGGIWTDALGDVAMRLAPITSSEAHRAFAELRGQRLLDGLRGSAPVDRDTLADTVARLSV
jgi:acetyltransferase